MEVIRTIIVPILLLIVIIAISIRHYKIAEGFNSGWSSDPPPNPFQFCPTGVVVLAINSSNQVHYECYKNGITNADAIFSSSNPIVNLEAPQGTTVSLYSDINGTGSIVASLPVQNEFNEPSFRSQLKGFKFKSIKVVLPPSTVPGPPDPTCSVGNYSVVTGGICTGSNTATDSEGDLPDSYSGLPDVTCPKGSGTSKKTGGICAGPIPDDGAVAWTGKNFGNAGGTNPPVPDVSGAIVDISGVDVSGNTYSYPNIPLADLLSMFNISTAKPKTTDTTDTTPAPVATASAATTAAPTISADTIRSMIRDEIGNEMCECEETPSIQQGCIVQKKKIDLSMNKQKDSIPCWGC